MQENRDYILDFIKKEDFELHLLETIKEYNESLLPYNLKKFNKNIIDPIKLVFDKNVFNLSYEELVKQEIQRQRDKSNNNIIGYFHQNIFKYIENCKVPQKGWDIVYTDTEENLKIYVELKNKHNTMNSSSAAKTYMRFQNHLLNSPDKNNSICALVEVIAKKSDNIAWEVSIDGEKQNKNEAIRRISIDKFYEIVTGDKDAFYKICKQIPISLEKIVKNNGNILIEKDSVLKELSDIDNDILVSLYKIAFETYNGFK